MHRRPELRDQTTGYTNGPFYWPVGARGALPLSNSPHQRPKGLWTPILGAGRGGMLVVPGAQCSPVHRARRDLLGLMTPPVPDANSRCPEAFRPMGSHWRCYATSMGTRGGVRFGEGQRPSLSCPHLLATFARMGQSPSFLLHHGPPKRAVGKRARLVNEGEPITLQRHGAVRPLPAGPPAWRTSAPRPHACRTTPPACLS